MDPAGIGKYGSLKVLKKKTDDFAACFPIDDEELTFGRNPECGVRLYYPTVSMQHCKIMFSDGHAFLVVLGSNGVTVDGVQVFPSMSEHPFAIPLEDGSIIEIQKKRFEFNYPPQNYRVQAVIDSPFTPRRRPLRMSMIEAAQIYTPTRPNTMSSPQGSGASEFVSRIMEEDGQNSVVIDNDKDIIVVQEAREEQENQRLEHIPSPPLISRSPSTPVRLSPPMIRTPVTAQRIVSSTRRRSEPSLHKAVLLRSAQRVHQERQREEQEEREVEQTVAPLHFSEEDEDDAANGPGETLGDIPDDVEEVDDHKENEMTSPSQPKKGTLRKSLEAVKGILQFKWASPPAKEENQDEEGGETELPQAPPLSDSESDNEEDAIEDPEDDDDELAEIEIVKENVMPTKTRLLGQFMTPQRVQPRNAPRPSVPTVVVPKSAARRVPILDLSSLNAVPAPIATPRRGARRVPLRITSLEEQQEVLEQLVEAESKPEAHVPVVSEEEKRLIREKRKSLNPEVYNDLPTLADWPKRDSHSSVKTDTSPPADKEDLNMMLARIKEQTSEMKRKSLARQSMPRRSESPIKVEAIAPLVPQVTEDHVKPKDENRNADVNPFAPTRKTSKQPGRETVSNGQLFSPSRSPERKIVDLPSLPTLDISTLPGLFKTPRNRQQVPQTPALKSVRDLFKLREAEPKLETPNLQAASQFILKLEEVAEAGDTYEVENLLEKSPQNATQQFSEEMEVEDDLKEIVQSSKITALAKKVTQPRELPQPMKRTRSAISASDPSDEGTDTKEIVPAKGRAGRVLRSADTTSDEPQTVVPANKPKRAGRRAVQQSSDHSDDAVKDEIVDTVVPLKPASKPSTRTRGRAKAPAKAAHAEEEDTDELDCLSPSKSAETRALRNKNDQPRASKKSKGAKSDTEASEKSSEEPKAKVTGRAATTGRAAGRRTRAKEVEMEPEDHDDKENSPVQVTKASRVPTTRRTKKEVKESEDSSAVEEVAAPRMTRTRARKQK